MLDYSDLQKRNLILFQSGVSIIGSSMLNKTNTYILHGVFNFFEGPKCLVTEDGKEIIVNKSFNNEDLSLIDNIHGKGWEYERSLYFPRFQKGLEKKIVELDNKNYCLINTQWAGSNVFHLVYDMLGKMSLMNEYRNFRDFIYLIPNYMKLCIEFMETFSIPYELFDPTVVYKGKIYVPSMPAHCGFVPRSVCKFMCQLGDEVFGTPNTIKPGIYIGRKLPSNRLILNQDDIYQYLKNNYFFDIVYFEDMPLSLQIKTIREARTIVGPHGSGMSWASFSNNPNLFEIHSPTYRNDCFQSMIENSLGLHYSLTGYVSDNSCRNDDFIMSLDEFTKKFKDFMVI